MTLRLGDVTPDTRYDAWTEVVQRIYREQVNQAWSHYMFRLLRAVFVTNPRLSEEGGFIFEWMVGSYVDSSLMLVRRELDRQAGTENLRNLMLDMIEHATVASRARYRSKWQGGSDHWFTDRVFDRFDPVRVPDNPGADHVNPDIIRADLDRISASAERLRSYAERTRAHRTPERGLNTAGMTFETLHEAIDGVRDIIKKYYGFLTLSSIAQWEPVPQYDTLEAFTRPWIIDRARVEQIVRSE